MRRSSVHSFRIPQCQWHDAQHRGIALRHDERREPRGRARRHQRADTDELADHHRASPEVRIGEEGGQQEEVVHVGGGKDHDGDT